MPWSSRLELKPKRAKPPFPGLWDVLQGVDLVFPTVPAPF